jgi:hypothetical protein
MIRSQSLASWQDIPYQVYGLQENMEIRDEGNDVTIIYEKGTDNCVATIIHAPGSSDLQ